MRLFINSIYRATEGEGIHVGTPQVFVRFQGCAIACVNCDSKDTWDFNTGESFSVEEVLSQIKESGMGTIKRVSITGGDPLHPKILPGVLELARELKARRYFVNIEAAGTRLVGELFDLVDFISFDVKTPSTGVSTPLSNLVKMHEQFEGRFQVKAVIENKEDFDFTLKTYKEIQAKKLSGTPWVLTPSYNLKEAFPKERFQSVVHWNETTGANFRVIGQQHKFIHGPDLKQI